MVSLSNGSVMRLLMLATSLIYITHTVNTGPFIPGNICPPDMVETCMRTCFGHCNDLNSTAEICTYECRHGCDCKNESFVLTSENSKVCILPSECKVSCPENMYFEPCLKKPEPTCGVETTEKEFPCKPRCVCNKDYVSNGDMLDRKCIKLSDCPISTN